MKKTALFTSALVALGIVSQASASQVINGTNIVYLTGSTAFRGNVFNVLSAGGNGVFDAGTVNIVPSGAGSGSGSIAYQGLIGGVPYVIDCNWTGSEAGIAATDGLTSLANSDTGHNIPGVPTTFVDPFTGAAGSSSTTPDLTFADTSQAVSLTKPPTYPALTSYGTVGIVTFTWLKGACSVAHRDSSWNDLTNVTQAQLLYQLPAGASFASFFTGQAADTDGVYTVGRNVGSGTHVNMMADSEYIGVNTPIIQYSWNASYNGSGVLTYDLANSAPFFPAFTAAGPDLVGHDGFDSGAGVSDVLSCDANCTTSHAIMLGYAGLSDAKHARDGQGTADGSSLANQPGGAVFLTLDGVPENDGNVILGTYSFWGHEHLYGVPSQSSSSPGGIVALKLAGSNGHNGAINAHGGLSTGATPSAQNTGIQVGVMQADKPSGGDLGYPSQN